MNSILVTEPVGALDGVVHVPSPVILVHVAERSVDTTLRSDGVRSGGEELGNAGSVEAGLGETESGTETGTAGTDNDGIVLVVLRGGKEPCQPLSLSRRRDFLLGPDSMGYITYDDMVLVVDMGRSLLSAETTGSDDAGCEDIAG